MSKRNRYRDNEIKEVPLPFEPDEVPKKRSENKADRIERERVRVNNRIRETLAHTLERLHITDWDLLLIGDGSGSNWNYECGWGCVSIEQATMERQVFYGSMNRGTVNFGEMMAYLQPLHYFAAKEDEERHKEHRSRRVMNIHIVTDSSYCANQGRSDDLSPKRNGALWRIFDDFERNGMLLHWHWTPRNNVGLNVYADKISKLARLLIKEHDLQVQVETTGSQIKTVYDFNPIKKPKKVQNESPT